MKKTFFISSLLILSIIMGGCSFSRLKKDLKEQERLVRIEGKVTAHPATKAPIMVVLLTEDPLQPRIINYKIMRAPGNFIFFAEPDVYRIFAYEDRNRDQRFQADERVGKSGHIELTKAGARADNLTIKIPEIPDQEIIRKIEDIRSRGKVDLVNSRSHPGKIVAIDDPAFKNEFVTMGLWQPLKFIQEVPFGIFFMEEYQATKTPILFVHGINGSPLIFKELIDNLDHARFQPWLAYYPSGLKLNLIADYLYSLLEELHTRHNFKQIPMVAHSMGGLVSRALINLHTKKSDSLFIDRLITISTPWAGHGAAEMGLKYAPAVIPVWNDVVPGSEFLEKLFSQPLPATCPHYLLFSFKGKNRFAGGNSDGVVTIASQLRPEAQNSAALVRGFDEDHTTILKNDAVSELLNQVLSHEQ